MNHLKKPKQNSPKGNPKNNHSDVKIPATNQFKRGLFYCQSNAIIIPRFLPHHQRFLHQNSFHKTLMSSIFESIHPRMAL